MEFTIYFVGYNAIEAHEGMVWDSYSGAQEYARQEMPGASIFYATVIVHYTDLVNVINY